MKVVVNWKHIDAGKQKNCNACPITLALREATSRTWYVGGSTVSDDNLRYKLPPSAQSWLARFDAGDEVQPFSFTITEKWVPVAA